MSGIERTFYGMAACENAAWANGNPLTTKDTKEHEGTRSTMISFV